MLRGRVLIVAGSDSGGGAGIQADIKACAALGAYSMTAITALTAQDTTGVHGVFSVPPAFVAQQMRVVLDDIGADAIKLGMLADAAVIDAVCDVLDTVSSIHLVVDPVMVAKGGARLLAAEAVAALKSRLLPRAGILTPNVPEAEALVGRPIKSVGDMTRAATELRAAGAAAVLVKGGHLDGPTVTDVLADADGVLLFDDARIDTTSTHGTGCTLASAIAAGLAQRMPLRDAIARARGYLRAAILAAPGLGHGHGPLGHDAGWAGWGD